MIGNNNWRNTALACKCRVEDIFLLLRKSLMVWVALTICLMLLSSCTASPTTGESPTPDKSSVPADMVEVVYFHRAQRCSSCIYAETGTRYTMETYFKDELASGKLIFKVVDVEAKENDTIVKKYGAFTSSLFINTIRNSSDQIEEVKEIWLVLGKDEAFIEVVKSKIERSLKE